MKRLSILLILGSMVLNFQNCSKQGFDTIDSVRKQKVLEDTVVLRDGVGQSVDIDLNGQVNDGDSTNVDVDGEVGEKIKITRLCSDARSRNNTSRVSILNAVTSNEMRLVLTDTSKPAKLLCEIKDRDQLLKDLSNPDGGFVDVSSCNLKKDQVFNLELIVSSGSGSQEKDISALYGKGVQYVHDGKAISQNLNPKAEAQLKKQYEQRQQYLKRRIQSYEAQKRAYEKTGANQTAMLAKLDTYIDRAMAQLKSLEAGDYKATLSKEYILMDVNASTLKRNGQTERAALCEKNASPLAIDMSASKEGLKLSSPEEGVKFDIQGAKTKPTAFAKQQISWVESPDYMLLTLPTDKAYVHGIDQLFGDNTTGPQGKFAPDGFAALAKYDGMSADGKTRVYNKDGYINRLDPVYSKLRLWSDKNLDGVATKDELKTLEELNIVTIDLKYDAKYKERDAYGNLIKYKSAVKIRHDNGDDELRLMFDIWFKL